MPQAAERLQILSSTEHYHNPQKGDSVEEPHRGVEFAAQLGYNLA
jgi:hypothetical protein